MQGDIEKHIEDMLAKVAHLVSSPLSSLYIDDNSVDTSFMGCLGHSYKAFHSLLLLGLMRTTRAAQVAACSHWANSNSLPSPNNPHSHSLLSDLDAAGTTNTNTAAANTSASAGAACQQLLPVHSEEKEVRHIRIGTIK